MTSQQKKTHPSLAGSRVGLNSHQSEGVVTVSHATNAANTPSVESDAKEFGLHVKQGGWRLGLLVARNVEIGEAGRPPKNRDDRSDSKVSGNKFADLSGVASRPRILRYLAAWERAAEAGHVPHADALAPGEELDLDVESLPDWNAFYTGAAGDFRIKDEERKQALIRQAEEDGVGRGKVQEIAANNKAMIAAIKADPKTALAAANALGHADIEAKQAALNKLTRDPAIAPLSPAPPKPSEGANLSEKYAAAQDQEEAARKNRGDLRVIAADAELHRAKRSIRAAMSEIEHVVLSDEDRAYLRDEIAKVVKLADLFTGHLDGDVTDWDAALVSLVGGE